MPDLRRLLLALVLACSSLVLAQAPAFACKCTDIGVKRAAERADVVFRGVLVEQSEGRRRSTATMEVERVYQGRLAETPVEVVSANNSCGLGQLRVDRSYVVFAGRTDRALRSDQCDGTAPATRGLVGEVERVLGPGNAVPQPRPPDEEPPEVQFTRVADGEPPQFTRLVAPGAALVLAGLLGLFVFRRRG